MDNLSSNIIKKEWRNLFTSFIFAEFIIFLEICAVVFIGFLISKMFGNSEILAFYLLIGPFVIIGGFLLFMVRTVGRVIKSLITV